MGKGKMVSQGAHASISAFLKSNYRARKIWREQGEKKVVLKVKTKKELEDVYRKAKKQNLPCTIIIDAAKTQLKKPDKTAVAIGPAPDSKIDKITGKLKLL